MGAFSEILNRHGAMSAAVTLGDRVINRVFSTETWDVLTLCEENVQLRPPSAQGITFRFLEAQEVCSYAKDSSYDIPKAMAETVEVNGNSCFGAFVNQRLASYSWYALRSIAPEHSGGILLSYPEHLAYMYKGFTHPLYRGQGLYGPSLASALRELKPRGVRELISLVSWTNWVALRVCSRHGWRRRGRLIVIRAFGPTWILPPRTACDEGIQFSAPAEATTSKPNE